MIDDFVAKNKFRAISFPSMGRLYYLSAMKYVDAVLGNSSSGIIETPSFKIPTVNVGDRQKGRVKAESIIDCKPTVKSIRNALKLALSPGFRMKIQKIKNPYEQKNTASIIVDILEKMKA